MLKKSFSNWTYDLINQDKLKVNQPLKRSRGVLSCMLILLFILLGIMFSREQYCVDSRVLFLDLLWLWVHELAHINILALSKTISTLCFTLWYRLQLSTTYLGGLILHDQLTRCPMVDSFGNPQIHSIFQQIYPSLTWALAIIIRTQVQMATITGMETTILMMITASTEEMRNLFVIICS